jgi:Protein of unknown function (DUF1524)
LGNLTLVHYGVNRSLQNSAFEAKRKALFEHSNLHLNRQLMQLAGWDEAAIAVRGAVEGGASDLARARLGLA